MCRIVGIKRGEIVAREDASAGDNLAAGRNVLESRRIHDGNPVGKVGVQGIGDAEDVVRKTGLPCGDAADLPAFQSTAGDAVCEMSAAATDVRQVDKINYPALPGVETRISLFAAQVEGINGEIAVGDGGNQGIGRIVESVCPGVGTLNLQAVEILFGDLHLQTVIPGMAGSLVGKGVEERVVVHGVEREDAIFRAEIEIGELQRFRSYAHAEQLVYQGGLRRIAINDAKDARGVVADVVHVEVQILSQLTLHAYIPGDDQRRFDIGIEKIGKNSRAVGNYGRRRQISRSELVLKLRGGYWADAGRGLVEEAGLKGRIPARVRDQVAVDTVAEYTDAAADGSESVLEGIPSEAEAGLKVLVIILEELKAGAGTDGLESEGRGTAAVLEKRWRNWRGLRKARRTIRSAGRR